MGKIGVREAEEKTKEERKITDEAETNNRILRKRLKGRQNTNGEKDY